MDPTIPSLNTYFDANPNSIEAIQRRLRQEALKYAEKRGPEGITFRELHDLFSEDIPQPDTRNLVIKKTAEWLKDQGVKVWQ